MHVDARLRNRSGAIAFMYHSVADEDLAEWIDPDNHVPAEIFAEQMAYLAAHRLVVSLDQLLLTMARGERVEDGTVVLTFDDGYLDNLTVAAPILARHQLPATLFLPSGYIDRGETQWVDQAYTAFRRRRARRLEWGADTVTRFDLDDPAEEERAYRTVCNDLLKARREPRRRMLDTLFEQLDPEAKPPRLSMNWDDVRRLLDTWEGFSLGGHTAEHTDVSDVPEDFAREEIQSGAERILAETGTRPRHFSFCYSRSTEPMRRFMPEAGFEAAFGACTHEPAINIGADLFDLPRVEPPRTMEGYERAASAINGGIWRRLAR
jgi:peptidoglycan/xylan/chitin deacetylase (PgdA/CDA1 family)